MATIYRTPINKYKWPCGDPECLKERDQWEGDDEEDQELVHCSNPGCHGVVWKDKGNSCAECGIWFCANCHQTERGCKYDSDCDYLYCLYDYPEPSE